MKLKKRCTKGKVANNTETAPLKWITPSPILTLPSALPQKTMYTISVRVFAIDWLFCLISFLRKERRTCFEVFSRFGRSNFLRRRKTVS